MARTPGNVFSAAARLISENGGCNESTCRIASPPLEQSASKFDTPAARIFPSSIQLHHFGPGILDARTCVRPMELIQIDALDTEPAERTLRIRGGSNRG